MEAGAQISSRDLALALDIREVLYAHRELSKCAVNVAVKGSVAHLSGNTRSGKERQALREAVSRVRGVAAVWETLTISGGDLPRVLDIGCGDTKQQRFAIGVDKAHCAGVEVVSDLELGLPFPDEHADQIYAIHFLEHVHQLVGLMNEIHRVLKPDGVLHAIVPHHSHVNAIADPTHVRFFHPQTFKYFCREMPGVRPFRPLSVMAPAEDIFVDLMPVKKGMSPASTLELARFFD
ncbi:MAG TPA: methyltransferase domain-containing protein [Gammaproteobacteria bacterium]